jgi:hypothetical protein
MNGRIRGLSVCFSLPLLGCVRELPAPEAPPREVPAVRTDMAPAAVGRQWVVFDTPNDRARVSLVTGTVSTVTAEGDVVNADATKELCTTPCVTDLRVGDRSLLFESLQDSDKHGHLPLTLQGGDPVVVRHVIASTKWNAGNTAGVIMMCTAVVAMGVGIPVLISSSGSGQHQSDARFDVGMTTTLRGGVGLFFPGLFLIIMSRDHTPGATTVWSLPKGSASSALIPPGPPALVRF